MSRRHPLLICGREADPQGPPPGNGTKPKPLLSATFQDLGFVALRDLAGDLKEKGGHGKSEQIAEGGALIREIYPS